MSQSSNKPKLSELDFLDSVIACTRSGSFPMYKDLTKAKEIVNNIRQYLIDTKRDEVP